MSAMNVCLSGTRLWSRASSRTSSRLGVSSRSTATLIEHLVGVGQRQPAAGHQHGEVVEDVGGLLREPLVGLAAGGPGRLLGLLADLVADPFRLGEQRGGVALAGIRRAALLDRALEGGQGLRCLQLHLAAVEAGALARVAGGARRVDECDVGVAVAVVPEGPEALNVAGGLALVPQLVARARPEPHLTGRAGALERLLVHVGEGEDLAGVGVLDDAGEKLHGYLRGASRPAS